MRITEFRRQFTPASRPDERTVRAWIARGEIWGRRIGGCWYVDPERDTAHAMPAPDAGLSERARRVLEST